MSKFIYFNDNPDGTKTDDCVTRAIAFTTGIPYTKIRQKLLYISKLYDCPRLCVDCYKHLIEDVIGATRINCKGLTVGEFANEHPYGTYIVRINGHVTCIIDNAIYDIWDCRDRMCDIAWRVD